MRSATPQAKELCRVWRNKQSTQTDKLNALHIATLEHTRLVRESANGMGVDRHLFALKCLAARKGMNTPKFFESAAWKTLNHTILSTSNCGNPSLRLFGFGPVVPDGFGIGYIIKNDGISYSVCSKHRQTRRFVRSLHTTLLEMKDLLKSASNVTVQHRNSFRQETAHSPVHPMSTYDDMFGESSVPMKPRTPVTLPTIDDIEEINTDEAKHRRRSSGFMSHVRERSQSIDILRASHMKIKLDGDEDIHSE
jgi:carnitine O-acetyltransferase